ncbi:MAG: hypothetical protein JWL59_4118 [Chthoniobacteraceae bacterium]|nr:hypothetical protein [Chthoniobacteraceae bacterium]
MLLGTELAGYGAVSAGNSKLISAYDYSDSFTLTANGGIAGRPDNVFPVGQPGINLERTYGNPLVSWPDARWSLNTDASAYPGSSYPGDNGAGSATGFTQTGGGWDASFVYGLRNAFVVQFDSVQAGDRVDIFTGTTGDINGGLSVFFRYSGHALPEIGIYNGAAEINTGLTTGIAAAGEWHNYAVKFSLNLLDIYVDEVSRGTIDLTSFNGGSFLGYSNQYIGVGNTGSTTSANFPISWSDNFQVGAAVPEPGSAAFLLLGTALIGARRRRASLLR